MLQPGWVYRPNVDGREPVRLRAYRIAARVVVVVVHFHEQPPRLLFIADALERVAAVQFLFLQPDLQKSFLERILDAAPVLAFAVVAAKVEVALCRVA
jgi:hypothetical protein